MKRLGSSLILLISILIAGCSSDLEETVLLGSISGSVSDITTGEPVASANVMLTPGGTSVVTGSDGSFAFEKLESGEYNVEVSKEGYTSTSGKVTVKSGENTFLHMMVGRLPSSIVSDKTSLDFGDMIETLSFKIVNRGYTDLEYVIVTGNCEWLSVKPAEGVLPYQ
ncbi:MAG: carboxypeptidase-like regulatory domain-containing protein, partial [Muribaculaceae bacterium]|nr:carboxypeptidase-like regulatory domain-containing protein [Muribaculaceae bacterium]